MTFPPLPQKVNNSTESHPVVYQSTNTIVSSEKSVKDAESEILLKVIYLTHDKIWSLLEKLRDPQIYTTVQQTISTMEADDLSSEDGEETNFWQWITRLPALMSLKPDATPVQLILHIKWAAQARWCRVANRVQADEGVRIPSKSDGCYDF